MMTIKSQHRQHELTVSWGVFFSALFLLGYAPTAYAVCLDPPGDVAGSVETNVVDVQCQILGTLWSLGGGQSPFPLCYKVNPPGADLDCDGSISIVDAVNTILLALSGQLDPAVDSDGNQCVDTCEPVSCGMGECDDGVACTIDHCVPTLGCVFAPIDSECDDGVACTVDLCTENTGCTHVPHNTLCPVYNPCSEAVCQPDSGCQFLPKSTPACLQSGVVCQWSAQLGEVKTCTIHLTNRTIHTPPPSALSFDLSYDAEKLRPLGVTVQSCVDGICSPQIAPPQTVEPGGQQLTFDPPIVPSWTGQGKVILWAFTPNPAPLSTAVMEPTGTIVGKSELLTFHFKVIDDVPPMTPTSVSVNNIGAATVWAQPLIGTVEAGAIVVQAKNCGLFPGSCNDDNVCTIDVCDPTTQQCAFTSMSCEDGNACITESCDATLGCQWSPAVCHDGIPCTLDSCDPQFGCVFVPQDSFCQDNDSVACTQPICDKTMGCLSFENDELCQDGDQCNGKEICLATVGCLPGFAANCNDGVTCTIDGCDPHDGCFYVAADTLCPHDGSPCSEPVCNLATGCELWPKKDGGCFSENAVCMVWGPAGQMVDCPIRVAKSTAATPDATGLQFDLTYNSESLQPTGAFVADSPMPPGVVEPGGQFLVTGPTQWSDWNGQGTVALMSFAAGAAPVSPAWFEGGSLVGNADLFLIRFELLTDIDPTSPMAVTATSIKGTTSAPAPMNGSILKGVMVLSPPTCVGMEAVCDDGIDCTLDQCNTTTGECTHIPLFALCPTDGVTCTIEQCVVGTGCLSVPNHEPCQDGDLCNGTEICTTSGCVVSKPPDCHDDVSCTVDHCDPLWGCTHTPLAALCPTSNEECTEAVCDLSAGCLIAPKNTGDCLPEGVLCAVSGGQGQWVDCPIRVVRDTQNSPAPTSIQLKTWWDSSLVTSTQWGWVDCGDDNKCSFVETPPNSLPSGAVVLVGPAENSEESTNQVIAAVQFSAPDIPLTEGVLAQGQVQGNADWITLRLRLSETVPPNDPLWVFADNIVGATQFAVTMPGYVKHGVVILTPAQCGQNPGQCDDGNVCTIDQCDPATQLCLHTPTDCNDGDFCTEDGCHPTAGCKSAPLECEDDTVVCTQTVCTPGIGCQHLPDHSQCEDDNNLCTTAVCDPQAGCLSLSIQCDDFDPCTGIEGCHPDIGCTPGVPKLCSDGDLCTNDSCIPYLSCIHVPIQCDDGIDCTDDVCNKQSGCVFTPQPDLCADGEICTDDICTITDGCVHLTYPCSKQCDPGAGLCGDQLCDPGDCMADCGNLDIAAGVDPYQLGTEPTILDFAKTPMEFWIPGVGFGQWNGQLEIIPKPLVTDPKGALGDTSLILTRPEPVSIHLSDCGQTVDTPITVEALGLTTTKPAFVEVENQTLNYIVVISAVQGSSSGQMTIRYLCAEGGDFELDLFVDLRLWFKSVDDNKWDFQIIVPQIHWNIKGGSWVHQPELPIQLNSAGVLVDRDQDGKMESQPLLGNQEFTALVGPGSCDCNEASDCLNECTLTELSTDESAQLPMNWKIGGVFGTADKNKDGLADNCPP